MGCVRFLATPAGSVPRASLSVEVGPVIGSGLLCSGTLSVSAGPFMDPTCCEDVVNWWIIWKGIHCHSRAAQSKVICSILEPGTSLQAYNDYNPKFTLMGND